MSEIKSFNDFSKVWESMKECTQEETDKILGIISDIKKQNELVAKTTDAPHAKVVWNNRITR